MPVSLRNSLNPGLNAGLRQSISSNVASIVLVDKFLTTQGSDQIITQSDDNIVATVNVNTLDLVSKFLDCFKSCFSSTILSIV